MSISINLFQLNAVRLAVLIRVAANCQNQSMFGKKTIRLTPALFARAEEAAREAGYSSVEEFVAHAVELELERLNANRAIDEKAQVDQQLRGLGYIE